MLFFGQIELVTELDTCRDHQLDHFVGGLIFRLHRIPEDLGISLVQSHRRDMDIVLGKHRTHLDSPHCRLVTTPFGGR
jgi:hypothetical protein